MPEGSAALASLALSLGVRRLAQCAFMKKSLRLAISAHARRNIALKSYMTNLHCLANEIYLELLG
jgi:hypothetical protein